MTLLEQVTEMERSLKVVPLSEGCCRHVPLLAAKLREVVEAAEELRDAMFEFSTGATPMPSLKHMQHALAPMKER